MAVIQFKKTQTLVGCERLRKERIQGGTTMNLRFRRSGLDFSRRRRKVNKTLAKEVGTWIGEIAIAVLFALVLVYFVGYRADG